MRHPILVSLAILFLVLSTTRAHATDPTGTVTERPSILLTEGEQRVLRIQGLSRYSLGSDLIRARSLPFPSQNNDDLLLLKAVRPGQTDLWVWKKDGSAEHRSVRVEKWTASKTHPRLEQAISRLDEVEVLISGSGVVLRGEVQTLSEAERISALTQGFASEVRDETSLSPSLLQSARTRLDTWLSGSGLASHLRVELNHGALWVRGALPQPAARASIEKQIRAVFPLTLLDLESLPDAAPTVHFKVFLLEIRRNRFSSFGLEWPAAIQAFQVSSLGIRDMLQLDVTLQALEGEGSARILSRPELVVRAPGEAELFAGGEFPVIHKTKHHTEVTWKQFGLMLKLKVTNVAGDRIRLEIFTEVSQLNPNLTEDPIPGLTANRIRTQVDARFGTPLFLSGLLQQGLREQARGLPLLRRLPILGSLFGSADFLNERSELVAILLPQSTPPPAPMYRVLPPMSRTSASVDQTVASSAPRTPEHQSEKPFVAPLFPGNSFTGSLSPGRSAR